MTMDISDTVATPDPNVRYLVAGGKVIRLELDADGHWADCNGVKFAFAERASSVDDEVRAGIGFFSLPKGHILNDYARGHDFAYSCPVYQAYNLRSEADEDLKKAVDLAPGYEHTITPELFEFLSRLGGSRFWECDKTND